MIGTLRRELLDRILIVNERHLRRILAVYLQRFNTALPQGILLGSASPPPVEGGEWRPLDYPADVSATYFVDEAAPGGRDPLAKGASPEAIRSALLPEDQAAFDIAYGKALSDARESLDLTGLFRMLERWRGLAVLQRDPGIFRRVARRAAEKLTGQPSPEDEPLAATRAKAHM